MVEQLIIKINDKTVSNLLKNGETRFRRKGYTFNKIVLKDAQFKEYHDMVIVKGTLYMHTWSIQCLHDTGDVTLRMGNLLCKFVLDSVTNNSNELIQNGTTETVPA